MPKKMAEKHGFSSVMLGMQPITPVIFSAIVLREKNQNKCLSSHKDPNVHFAEKQFVSVWELKGSSKAESPNLSFKVDKSFSSSPSRQLGASHQAEECAISGSSQQLKCDGQSESDLSCKVKELMSTAEQSVVTTDDSGIDLPQTLNQCRGELSSDKKALEVHREFVSVSAPQHEPFFLNRIADTSDVKNSNMPHSAESGSFPVVLTTYEVAIRDSSFLERINFKALVVDEAQRIKRASSKLFQCLKGFDADIRLVVTGTPLQNNISELWSLLHFILPEIFSLGTDFSVWFDPIGLVEQVGRDRLAAQEAEHALVTNLRKVIRPFMLRRTKSEAKVFLPPKREVVLRVNLAPIQKTLYDFVTDTLRNEGILFVPKKQPGGSITMLDKRNILPQSRRNAPGTLAKENFRVSSSDEKSKIEAEVKSQPKRRVGRPRKINPPNAPADVDSGAYSSSAVNSDVEKFLPKVADPQDNPYDFEFLPEVMRSNRLMLLRRIVNHPYLAIEPPKEFYSTPSPQRNSSQEGEDDEAVSSNRLELLLSASGKMRLLDKLLQELLADGHKTLIFSQFTMALDMIEELLKVRKWEWVRLDGAMRFETRQTAVHRFNTTTAAELPIFLLSTRAGGLGLNLQAAADTVIIHDSDWNPQLDLQAQDRCHRIGQEKPVLVLRLVSAGTIEEAIYARALAKRGLERLLLYKNTTLTGSTDFLELDGSISDEFDSVPMANKSTFKINQASGKGLSANESSGSKDAFDLMQLLDAPEQATEPTIDAETISDAELKRILSREFDDQQIPNASEDNTGANVLEPRKSLPSGDSPELTTHGMAELCANNSNGRAFPESEAKAKVTNLNCYSDRRRRISAKLATDPGTRSRSSRKLTCKSPIAKEDIHSAKRSRVHRSPESQISPDSSSLARGSESTRVDSISDLVQESQKMVVFSACSDAKNPPAQLLRRSSRSPVTHLLGVSGVNSFASSDNTEPAAAAVGRKSITRPASRRGLPNQPPNVTPVSQRLLRSGMTLRQASENPCSSTSIVEVVKTTKAPLRHTFPRQVLPLKSSATADLKKSGNCDLAPRCSRISQLSTGEHNTVSQVSMSTGLRHCTGLSRSFKSLEDRTILFSKFKPPALRCNPKKGPLLLPKPKLLADEVEE
uniref:Lymphoid-specific helicase n=1 Tax=Schistocephalus solidus TaxID=70667 RepID=A0A0X3NGN7_SCHSO